MSEIEKPARQLSAIQLEQVQSFLNLYGIKAETPRGVSQDDQLTTGMKEVLCTGFEIEINNPAEYYRVMAGGFVATDYMLHLLKAGVDPSTAADAVRDIIAAIAPEGILAES